MKGILGKKLGMSQIFEEHGVLIPVTVIEVKPNVVLELKTNETKDKYFSTTLASEDINVNKLNKALQGKFSKTKITPKRYIKEIKNMQGYKVGDIIKADIFKKGEFVDVSAISKGKGFAGVIKRHNFSRGPMAHGSGYHRGIGSMGVISPNRIPKGKKMPGRMGHKKVTIQNLEVILVDANKNLLLVKGSVPGPKKSLLIIKSSIKKLKSNLGYNFFIRNDKNQNLNIKQLKEEKAAK